MVRESPLRSSGSSPASLRKRRSGAPTVSAGSAGRRRSSELGRAPVRTGSRLGEDDRQCAVHRGGDLEGSSAARRRLGLERVLDVLRGRRRRRHRAVGDQRDALAVEAEPVDRLEPDADVLQRRHLRVADEQSWSVWSSAASIAASNSGPVSMTTVVRAPRGLEHGGDLRLTDDVGLLRPSRRREHERPVRGSLATNASSFSTSMSPADARGRKSSPAA